MTTTYAKSEIFKMAWGLAKAYAAEEGTGSKAQFGRALREIHASIKLVQAQAAEDAAHLARRKEWLHEELTELEAARFSPKASAEKDRNYARRNAIREELASLAA